MTSEAREKEGDALKARVDALSPRRLVVLCGGFLVAVAALIVLQLREDVTARRVETELRVSQAASDCSAALNVAIMTGESGRAALAACHPGGRAAIFHLSQSGDILTAYGAGKAVDLDAATARALTLDRRGEGVLDLASGKAAASWRPLDNGEALLVAAPAGAMFAKTPLWVSYALILAAISLVTVSLLAAFIRQSRAAAEAAGAVVALRDFTAALAGGRCSPWRYDGKERTIQMSRTLLEPLGLGARDRLLTLREISALIHPDDLRTALAIITGDPSGVSEGPARLREPGGGWSRIYLRTAPDATRFERRGVAFDLSGAKGATPASMIAEARLKDAIESIPEAFVLWDAQGRLALWNKRFASIFRFPERGFVAGISSEEAATLARTRGDIILQYFAPEAALDQQSVEVALPGDRWLHVSRRRTAEGGLVCIASNVTDMKRRARAQKKKERELKSTVDDLKKSRSELSETMQKYELEKHRAEEASRSKSEFLANMSHELRTPLNAINGFSEIMQSELYGPLGDGKYKEYISDILASGRHLLELIDDILDMSKIEAGRIELDPKRVELERVLSESVRLVAKRAADAGVRLTASVRHAPAVWADARAVKQVTLNLLSNALKFTPAGGEVTITAEADLDGVTVIVADSGAGIEKPRLKTLGLPFELAGDYFSKSRQGSGIGLALSKSLMDLQGGILAIASQPGKGTVACATFPRRKDAKVRLPQFMRGEAHILTGPRPDAFAPASEAAE
ncbi:MAG: histidine kinase dimerization/phospho-acceptor domain-containing protein [Pseudomonadota bacterium]|nr:histidine kinase dimerization/phospho-acceptor domain-containing protein [Pseudomonadota bacterium]